MRKIHIANTFFEWELESDNNLNLTQAFSRNNVFLQLQFLPLIYAEDEDFFLVSDQGCADIPSGVALESWGASRLIANWAKEKGIPYEMPDWEVVKRVNSKAFSFEHAPRLPNARLLTNEDEARKWIETQKGPSVLKTCYGVSGGGHLHVQNTPLEKIMSFLQREWQKNRPVIAEPWVDRHLDFSTQWVIEKDKTINYIGATICENDERGKYRLNRVGHIIVPQLQEHIDVAEPILQKMAQLGYFGHVGIDAMIYDEDKLHPIVEINARKTMGWAAIAFQKRYFPNDILTLSYAKATDGLLPSSVTNHSGKEIRFLRNLMFTLNAQNG